MQKDSTHGKFRVIFFQSNDGTVEIKIIFAGRHFLLYKIRKVMASAGGSYPQMWSNSCGNPSTNIVSDHKQ